MRREKWRMIDKRRFTTANGEPYVKASRGRESVETPAANATGSPRLKADPRDI
jgi:hypothetical protein